MYKELAKEIEERTGEEFSPNEIALEAHVQYTEVKSIFLQPIKLREIVLYFMWKKSKLSAAEYMGRLERHVQKALEAKLEAKIQKLRSSRKK